MSWVAVYLLAVLLFGIDKRRVVGVEEYLSIF